MSKGYLNRRTFLQGSGAILALPMLEAMIPERVLAANAINRFVAMSFPFGIYSGNIVDGRPNGAYVPRNTGLLRDQELPVVYKHLGAHKNNFSIISGLNNRPGSVKRGTAGGHCRGMSSFLTASSMLTDDVKNKVAITPSADRIIAGALKGRGITPLHSSLVMSASTTPSSDGDGAHPDYVMNISFDKNKAAHKYVNPRALFDALFKGATSEPSNPADNGLEQSILDQLVGSATELKKRLGAADQARVEEYMDGIRTIERNLASLEEPSELVCKTPSRPVFNSDYKATPQSDYPKRVEVFLDILVAAFQCDLSRVATLCLDPDGLNNSRDFSQLIPKSQAYMGVEVIGGNHHDMAHYGSDKTKIYRLISVQQYQANFFGRLMSKMAAVSEPNGTLLDNSMILYGCGLGNGSRHEFNNLALAVGGRGGGLRSGMHYNFPSGYHSNLLRTLIEKMGVDGAGFGDSKGVYNI